MTSTSEFSTATPVLLMEEFAARAAAGDLDGLVDLYEPDGVFEPEFGARVAGHDQLRGALAEFIALRPQITYTSEPDVVIVGDVALVSNFWTMTGTATDGSRVGETGTSADVCRRQGDGTWRVLIDQPRGTPSR